MNNLSSYCGLTDSRMSASDTDLPVSKSLKVDFYRKSKKTENLETSKPDLP